MCMAHFTVSFKKCPLWPNIFYSIMRKREIERQSVRMKMNEGGLICKKMRGGGGKVIIFFSKVGF